MTKMFQEKCYYCAEYCGLAASVCGYEPQKTKISTLKSKTQDTIYI